MQWLADCEDIPQDMEGFVFRYNTITQKVIFGSRKSDSPFASAVLVNEVLLKTYNDLS